MDTNELRDQQLLFYQRAVQPFPQVLQSSEQPQGQSQSQTLDEQRIQLELARQTITLRQIELQIAAEKRKEKEAELALAQLHVTHPPPQAAQPFPTAPLPSDYREMNGQLVPSQTHVSVMSNFDSNTSNPFLPDFSSMTSSIWPGMPLQDPSLMAQGPLQMPDLSYNAFGDIFKELMVENPFSDFNSQMLPQMNGTPMEGEFVPSGDGTQMEGGLVPPDSALSGGASDETNSAGDMLSGSSGFTPNSEEGNQTTSSSSGHDTTTSPMHLDDTVVQAESSTGAVGTRQNKKQLVEHAANCAKCGVGIAKLLFRGTRTELDVPFSLHYLCERCASPIVIQTARKRTKQTDNTALPTICDVCLRNRGRGGIVPDDLSNPLPFAVEFVCLPCTLKYKRCSDCGGGSGRLGVGKWRCKELFDEGRKTCNLSHARLGTGDLEVAIWEVPKDVENESRVEQVLYACENLWRENVLRMAVPEVLDADDDSPTALHTYQDIETRILNRGWLPLKLLMQEDAPRNEKRTYLSLTWAKNRPRRGKTKTSTMGPRNHAIVKDEDWLFANIRKTRVFQPAGSMLVGFWIIQWDVKRHTVYITKTYPYDSGDLEDTSMVTVAETMSRMITDGAEDPTISPPAHMWISYNEASPVLQTRLEDTLMRKKRFVPLEEYVQRVPDCDVDQFVEPSYITTGSRGWTSGGDLDAPVKILVKTLAWSLKWYKVKVQKMREVSLKKAEGGGRKRKHSEGEAPTLLGPPYPPHD